MKSLKKHQTDLAYKRVIPRKTQAQPTPQPSQAIPESHGDMKSIKSEVWFILGSGNQGNKTLQDNDMLRSGPSKEVPSSHLSTNTTTLTTHALSTTKGANKSMPSSLLSTNSTTLTNTHATTTDLSSNMADSVSYSTDIHQTA